MAASYNATVTLGGGATQQAAGGGASVPQNSWNIGSSLFPTPTLTLTTGTGNQQANNEYIAQRTLTAGSSDDLDVSGSLTNAFGVSIVATAIKGLIVAIVTPDGTKSLEIGPGASSNPITTFGMAASSKLVTFDWIALANTWAGWAVTAATADVLRIKNPSAVNVTYNIWIATVG